MEPSELITEIKKGNEQVLCEFYAKYRNNFLSYAIKRYNLNIEILKEVYQDAILAIRNNIVNERLCVFTCHPRTYLFEVCNHLIGKELRKNKREVPFPEHLEYTCADDNENIHSKMEISERQEIIRQEMKKLGDKCFQLLYLFYFEKKRMEEIAEILHYRNVDSAKSSKHNCMQRLKENILEKRSHFNLQ